MTSEPRNDHCTLEQRSLFADTWWKISNNIARLPRATKRTCANLIEVRGSYPRRKAFSDLLRVTLAVFQLLEKISERKTHFSRVSGNDEGKENGK